MSFISQEYNYDYYVHFHLQNDHFSTGDLCPAGLYCEAGTVMGTGCPKGTFSVVLGLMSAPECPACTPGYYCGQTGLTAPSGTCWAGQKLAYLYVYISHFLLYNGWGGRSSPEVASWTSSDR